MPDHPESIHSPVRLLFKDGVASKTGQSSHFQYHRSSARRARLPGLRQAPETMTEIHLQYRPTYSLGIYVNFKLPRNIYP